MKKMPLNRINYIPSLKLATFDSNNQQIFLPSSMEEDILNKLFNESDLLGGPYSLYLPNDGGDSTSEKKGSELMTYQPMYDLSDIINDQNDLDADVNNPTTSKLQTQEEQPELEYSSSVLNTPYHE